MTLTSTYLGSNNIAGAATLHPINKDFIKALDCCLFDIKTVLLLHASMAFLCADSIEEKREEKHF